MPWRTDLLNPIEGDNPAGVDLRYDPVYDKIKEARREEDEAPQGKWTTTRKVADWALVVKLCGDALATKTKDLQLAAWLTEAMLRREGYSGLRGGVEFVTALIEKFWDNLYPEIEDGDVEMRAAPLNWLGLKLDIPVKMIPINKAQHTIFNYAEARTVVTEEDAKKDPYKKGPEREKQLKAGKLAPEIFYKSVEETPKAFYKQMVADIDGTLKAIEKLDKMGDEKFPDDPPSYMTLRKALEEVRQTVKPFLDKKLETDPDPPEPEPVVVEEAAPAEQEGAASEAGPAADGAPATLSLEPVSREDAGNRLAGVAKYLRKQNPSDPVPYLTLRAWRWGEIRGAGPRLEPKMLAAPPTAQRAQLKLFLLDGRWGELLEGAEQLMATPAGRGWLDLQRYAVTACDRLGQAYALPGGAIRASLRAYLKDVPQLLNAHLMDDTPTANSETAEWIAREIELDAATSGENAGTGGKPDADRTYQVSLEAARGGDSTRALGMITGALASERSERGRFVRRTQLAHILVESGQHAIALPLLEDLLKAIDEHKLELWEAGEFCSQPLYLMHKVLTKVGDAQGRIPALYLRICKLDPLKAIECAR